MAPSRISAGPGVAAAVPGTTAATASTTDASRVKRVIDGSLRCDIEDPDFTGQTVSMASRSDHDRVTESVYTDHLLAHSPVMGEVRPIPTLGGVLPDVRGSGRSLRVSWHGEDGLVVLSLWDGVRCTGTVRLAADDVPALVEALQIGLRSPLAHPATPPGPLGDAATG